METTISLELESASDLIMAAGKLQGDSGLDASYWSKSIVGRHRMMLFSLEKRTNKLVNTRFAYQPLTLDMTQTGTGSGRRAGLGLIGCWTIHGNSSTRLSCSCYFPLEAALASSASFVPIYTLETYSDGCLTSLSRGMAFGDVLNGLILEDYHDRRWHLL